MFSDPVFVFFFLPASLILLIFCRGWMRNAVIALLSLSFYFWGAGMFVLLLLASVATNWLIGALLEKSRSNLLLWAGIAFNLAFLGWFKYAYFISSNLDFLVATDFTSVTASVILPIGISFFTFQGISYLIDVRRSDTPAETSLIRFAAYLTFFPQLIAGPIVRYASVREDFRSPAVNLDNFSAGASRFAHGLFKKVVIADGAGRIADACFGLTGGEATLASAWLGAIAYSIQIYFDFSGYSDMAIGIGLMCGIRIPENFNRPYSSRTITEFWRRWHISLSTWFRDYVYIPLGGNQNGSYRTYFNLVIVFVLTGFWHGAAWTFLLWGLYHGAFLVAERMALGRSAATNGHRLLNYVYALPVIVLGWVIFRADGIGAAGAYYSAMFDVTSARGNFLPEPVIAAADPISLAGLFIGLIAVLWPRKRATGVALASATTVLGIFLRTVWAWFALAVSAVWVLSTDYSPFLYFRF